MNFFFFFQNARNHTVYADMPGTASFWLSNEPIIYISTAVEEPNFVLTLSKAEDKRKSETHLCPNGKRKIKDNTH